MAKHAAPDVRILIVGNEPNLNRFWLPQFNADGTNASVVATVPASGSMEIGGFADVYSLCWSADGARFVFSVPDGDPQSHIWVVNVNGSELTQVTSAPGVWDFSVSCTQ